MLSNGKEEILVGREVNRVKIDVVRCDPLRIRLFAMQSESRRKSADRCFYRHPVSEIPLGSLLEGSEHTSELTEGECQMVVAEILNPLNTDFVVFPWAHIKQRLPVLVLLRTRMNFVRYTLTSWHS